MGFRPNVQVVKSPQMKRVSRTPQHTWHLRTRPWQIQPFMIAPVQAGETFTNFVMQARVVTDPIKNPLIGWWKEYYWFYVKLNDLDDRANLTNMLLDPSVTLATVAADTDFYHMGGRPDFVKDCLKRVVEENFRNEGEAWDAFKIGDLPLASIGKETGLDSLISDTAYEAAAVDPELTVGADDKFGASEIDNIMRQYQFLRANQLVDASYEDYLRSFGVRPKEEELHVPELLRFSRDWTYPTNTVDPTNGTPRSACSWAISERADKDRFFREPGFIYGVTVSRPKVYFSKQTGNLSALLDDAYSWLPAILNSDTRVGYQRVAAATAPVANATDAYWLDVKDLFTYGDQFINFALTETDAGLVALPTSALQKKYAASTDADALFVSAAPANQIREDGVCNLIIKGRLMDTTAQT